MTIKQLSDEARAKQAAIDAAVRRREMLTRKSDSTRAVLQQTDRIITGRSNLGVQMVWPDPDLENNPAWTDGETVFLNKKMAEKYLDNPNLDMRDFVLVYKGTNYHEVAHILFSPRAGDGILSMIHQAINAQGAYSHNVWQAYMMLEDQRIETLYTSMYSPTSVYFVASCLKWLLSDTSRLADVYPLIYGRKFLPLEVRMACRQAFVAVNSEKMASDFEKCIDSFLTIVLPKDEARAYQLIMAFAALLTKMGAKGRPVPTGRCRDGSNPTGTGPSHSKSGNAIRKGRAYQKDAKEAAEITKDVVEQDKLDRKEWEKAKAEEAEAETDDADDLDGDGGEGEGADAEPKGGEAKEGSGKPSNSDSDGQGEQVGGEGGTGAGAGRDGAMDTDAAGTGISYDPSKLLDILNDVTDALQESLDDAMKDRALQQDVNDTVKSIKATSEAQGDVDGKYGRCKDAPVPSNVLSSSRKISKTMAAIKSDLEPAWNRQQMTGRLNERRALQRKADPGVLDIFDQWDEGSEEEAVTEVVILVDLSGSMGSVIHSVSEVLWSIKRAYDKVGIRTTAIGFSDGHTVLYKASDKAHASEVKYFDVHGGTDPSSALKQAHSILARSQATNRLLVAITDGIWSGDYDQNKSIVRSLRKLGVVTMVLGMGSFNPHAPSYYGENTMPQFDVTEKVANADEAANAIKLVVKEFIRRLTA